MESLGKNHNWKNIIFWLFLAFIILIVMGICYYFFIIKRSNTTSGQSWLETSQKISDQKLFIDLDEYNANTKINYEKIGSDNGHDLIIAIVTGNGINNCINLMLLKNNNNSYSLLNKYSNGITDKNGNYNGPTLSNKLKFDNSTTLNSITYQKTLSINGQSITNYSKESCYFPQYSNYFASFNSSNDKNNTTLLEYSKISSGTIYQLKSKDDNGNSEQEFILKLSDFMTLVYQLRPVITNEMNIPNITWDDGLVNKDIYLYSTGNFELAIDEVDVLESPNMTKLVKVGKDNNGNPIYQPQTSTNHDIFYWQDKLGRFIVFHKAQPYELENLNSSN